MLCNSKVYLCVMKCYFNGCCEKKCKVRLRLDKTRDYTCVLQIAITNDLTVFDLFNKGLEDGAGVWI